MSKTKNTKPNQCAKCDNCVLERTTDKEKQHAADTQMKRTQEETSLQLAKLQLVMNTAKIGLWDMEVRENNVINPDNPFTWSDEFRRLLGYTDENDFPNLMGSFTERLHPEDLDRTNAAFVAHLLDKTGKTPYNIEYRAKMKNGQYHYYHATGEAIRDKDGNPLRAVGAIMDITETKQTIIKMQRLKEEAERANKSKSAFLSTMSHEIRTPMNAILGITEILLHNSNISRDVALSLEKIYSSGDLLLGIINDILDLSKIEAGKFELNNEKYDIASVIGDTAQLNMMRIGSKQIDFEMHIDENLPVRLYGDELRVKQILNNLLSNAFKYTAEGKVTLTITQKRTKKKDETTLIITIADTGQGMTKQQVNALFDEYSRFNQESNRTTEGTGLGMSITRNLLKLMGGDISVKSSPGKGTTVTIHLPQGTVDNEVLGPKMAENLQHFRTKSRSQMRRVQITREPMPYGSVLVVDDVETNLYVAKGLLSPYLLKVDTAESGFEAIERINEGNEYDIVFMDHMMPEMDGIEAAKRMRAKGYKLPIVALTANAVAGQADIFLNNGFDDFISKPIDIRQLNNVLNKLIRDKKPPEVVQQARKNAKNKEEELRTSDIADPQLAEVFVRDAKKSLPALEIIAEKGESCSEEEIRKYVINVHGLKSALANIGKLELSTAALKLESLGRENNAKAIANETPVFLRNLKALLDELESKNPDNIDGTDVDKEYFAEKLIALKAACDNYDEKTADDILVDLKQRECSAQTRNVLNTISEHLLHSDFEEAGSKASEYVDTLKQGETGGPDISTLKETVKELDVDSGLEKFNGDKKFYIKLLRSYTVNTRKLLDSISTVDESNLSKYCMTLHSIKGTSSDIYATKLGEMAGELEKAAKSGDVAYINKHNGAFLSAADTLIKSLETALSDLGKSGDKPKKDKPDDDLLAKLKSACECYDMNTADAVMDDIEQYQYETDDELVSWLRNSLDLMQFDKIVEKLS